MYTVNIIKSLLDAGKKVDLIYLTSGDYAGEEVGLLREKELANAAEILKIRRDALHLLRFSERKLSAVFSEAIEAVADKLKELQPDCVITHEYEGGHNIHDLVSYCAYLGSKQVSADLWSFPAYHKQPHERLWNQFSSERKADFTLELDETGTELKHQIFDCHKTQKEFFDRVLASSSKDVLLQREVLRFIGGDLDYTSEPTTPVGYEFTGSPVKFDDFSLLIKANRVL